MENKKRKRPFLERFLEYAKLNDDDDFDEYYYDEDLDDYYDKEREKKKQHFYNAPLHYENERLIDKLILGELLNLGDIEDLLERTLKEFKRTFSAPNKEIEIVFREFKGNDFKEVIEGIFDESKDTKDKDIKSKDGDKDEKERT